MLVWGSETLSSVGMRVGLGNSVVAGQAAFVFVDEPVGARNPVVAGQAAILYSLMRPLQRVFRAISRAGLSASGESFWASVGRGGCWSRER